MISVFLPTRANSKRIADKNTRAFADIKGGLLHLKLTQLLTSELITEIILSTNDSKSMKIAHALNADKITVTHRPESLAQDTTPLEELIAYAPSVCQYEHLLWTHVTSPFITGKDYDKFIRSYLDLDPNEFDSLMTARKIQGFLWNDLRKGFLHDTTTRTWPRTQDIEPLYEVDNACFLASKAIYTEFTNRIGRNPFIFENNPFSSFDIDWPEDFKLAEDLYTATK